MLPEERDIEQLFTMAHYCQRAMDAMATLGNDFDSFKSNSIYQDATSLCIIQIGEAVNRLSDSFKTEHDEIKWANIYGMRNHLVHGYDTFDAEIAWDALCNYIPALHSFCLELLNALGTTD